jgi:hypothetical protein
VPFRSAEPPGFSPGEVQGLGDDPLFEVPSSDLAEAKIALAECLNSWCDRWVQPNGAWMLDFVEDVDLSRGTAPLPSRAGDAAVKAPE